MLNYPGESSVITRVLIRRRQGDQSQRKRCDDRSRDWSDAATSQGILEATRFSPTASRGSLALPTP